MMITISGDPVPLKRHRTSMFRGKVIQFDPQKKEKQAFAYEARQAVGEKHKELMEKSYHKVEILFEMPYPASKLKKGSTAIDTQPHTKKPDIDNLVKFVLDACNGILWEDDKKIVAINAKKIYSLEPKTKIYICS